MSANNEQTDKRRVPRLPDLLDELDGWANASSFPTKEQVGNGVARQVVRRARLDELDRGYNDGDSDEEY